MKNPAPPLIAQVDFWNRWVTSSRKWMGYEDDKRREARVLAEITPQCHRFIDVGCGNGWLANRLAQFGEVTAVDLASAVISQLKLEQPEIKWIDGDFTSLDLPLGHFDFASSLEVIASVADQELFARRLAQVLRPGGILVLTSQNPYVWSRVKSLKNPEFGHIRNWPSRQQLIEFFEPYFVIQSLTTCSPGADRGLPGLLSRRKVAAIAGTVCGRERWTRMLEYLGLGRSLVLVALRK